MLKFLPALIIILLSLACSSSKISPILPDNSSLETNPLIEYNTEVSSHKQLGAFTATFDIENLEATAKPDRTLTAHHNITDLIPTPLITINSWDPVEEIIDIDIQLHNPTWINVYDVRLIIFTDPAGHLLLNDDNWTPLWDIPDGQIANPFKAYAKYEPNRVFSGENWHQENFQIKCPNSNFTVQFAVDASYPDNCDEPYEISNFQQSTLKPDIGSEATLRVDIFDWQDEMSDVVIYAQEITGEPFTSFDYDSGNTWTARITNNNGVGIGLYDCFIKATSLNTPGISLYKLVTVQVKEKQGWAVTEGGAFSDSSYGCALDQVGNVYVTGMAEWDNNPDLTAIFLYKYSNNGGFQWGHVFHCDKYACGNSVVCDNSNNVYLTGSFNETIDFDPGPDLFELTADNKDAFLCKYEPNGDFIWAVNWGEDYETSSSDMAFNGEDELILACREDCNIVVRYFNLDGVLTGNLFLGPHTWNCNFPTGIAIDNLNNIYVTGQFSGSLDFDAGPDEDIRGRDGYTDMFLFKYDSARQFQWAKIWGSNSTFDNASDVAVDSQANVFVTGDFRESCDFDPGPGTDSRSPRGSNDIFLVKFDTDGIYNWVHTWGGSSGPIEYARGVCVDEDDNVYAIGSFTGQDVDFNPGPDEDLHDSSGWLDIFVSKFDTTGDFQWVLTLGSIKSDYGNSVVCDPDKNVYFAGFYMWCPDFDPGPDEDIRCARGLYDPFLAKYNSSGSWD